VMLADYGPIAASLAAIIVALLAWLSSRKPKLDDAQVDKIKTEIEQGQEANRQDKARSDIKRDRHIVRLEQWGFERVMPWGRRAATVVDTQNALLAELASRAGIEYHPQTLAPFPEMPQIDDEVVGRVP
jgi:hypothetical protein